MSNIEKVMTRLNEMYPEIKPELEYSTDFEFLIAVILSAQCTDKRVNIVTRELFKTYNKPSDFATLSQQELEKMIYSTGFYHNKAKNIISLSKTLVNNYGGQLPKTADELQKLDGVGRKTANVVASCLYGEPRIGVDTHVLRVTNRLGLVDANTPEKVEQQWCKKYKKYVNHDSHFRLVLFGRYFCKAQKPNCAECEFTDFCKYFKSNKKSKTKRG